MAESSGASPTNSNVHRDEGRPVALEPKHKIFLSHSGAQKLFVHYLCEELEKCLLYPFFDLREDCLPIGENFPNHIFAAIRQCEVGVVILSEEFLTSKWPMMELVAMVEEAQKREDFKLIPVFYGTSLADFGNEESRKRWHDCWDKLASENPGRINVEKSEAALKYLRPLSGLVKKGQPEHAFLMEIVDRICPIVPAEKRLEDSHIQGRSRLCKVIVDKIHLQLEKKSGGVCILGLYGMGGIGKTTICKALCNEFSTKFRGRVCLAELKEERREEELLRDVLKRLSNIRKEVIDESYLDELKDGLNKGTFIKEAVFLAVDNVSDSVSSIAEAKVYISAKLPVGSIVMVTTRSKKSLALLGLNVDGNECMRMPELERDEARALFVKSCEGRNEDDEQLIQRCVERCRFWNVETSSHYHPLALVVLGKQLAWLDDAEEWKAQLDRIDDDIFNLSSERYHPIFSILRSSFDSLLPNEQLLFFDVALFLPMDEWRERGRIFIPTSDWKLSRMAILEWLAVVNGYSTVEDVVKALKKLRDRSLLESIGDERSGRSIALLVNIDTERSEGSIGMHDLWRDFCVSETRSGELSEWRWVYERGTCSGSSPCDNSPSGNCWEKVKRMGLLRTPSESLERVKFSHFLNVTVLIITVSSSETPVDLSPLTRLRSLEISKCPLVVQGLPRDLSFLSLTYPVQSDRSRDPIPDSRIAEEIAGLKKLQRVHLIHYRGGKLPDMQSMSSLRCANFWNCSNVETVAGLNSNLRYLQVLEFRRCKQLRSCPGVGELVALEELSFRYCDKLENLPNLGRLRKLQILVVSWCLLITELPGVGDLKALEQLHAEGCKRLLKLGDLSKLRKLRVLKFLGCLSMPEVLGVESLISLELLEADFREVVNMPNLRQLTKLQILKIYGWSSAGTEGLNNLTLLEDLEIGYRGGVRELPDFRSLTRLRSLTMECPGIKDLSNLRYLSSLETLLIRRGIRVKPVMEEEYMNIQPVLWDNPGFQFASSTPEVDGCRSFESFPDLAMFSSLQQLELLECSKLSSRVHSSALRRLELISCETLTALPDLAMFPALEVLRLTDCSQLGEIRCSVPCTALRNLQLRLCNSLTVVPDLAMFPAVEYLLVRGCCELKGLSCSGRSTALMDLIVDSCNSLTAVPDLSFFPELYWLCLEDCSKLTAVSSSVRLTKLTVLRVVGCSSVSQNDVDLLRGGR